MGDARCRRRVILGGSDWQNQRAAGEG
jgi:hypothetical protein